MSVGTKDKLAFAFPAALFTALVLAFPFVYTIYLGFQEFDFTGTAYFAGLNNYARLVNDPEFWNAVRVSAVIYFACLILQLVAGTYMGMVLYHSQFMGGLLRSILISPFMLPPVVVGMMFLVIFDPSLGAANYVLELFGIGPSLWLSSPRTVIPTIVLLDTWQWTPFVALIVLGGLQSLPHSVYEAAAIDGARRGTIFFRITLPMLGPTIMTAAILRSVDLLRFFDIIYITTGGGPTNASNAMNIYAFRIGFEYFDLGYAAALMLTLTALVLGAVIVLNRLRRRVEW
jgi:multiple sugar transport system permease protein